MFFSKSIYFTIFLYFIIGVTSGGRIAVGTMYLNEFIPNKYQKQVITAMNSVDSCTMIIQGIYYTQSNNWVGIHSYGLVWCFVATLGAFLLPESPKFYYANRRFHEARDMLKIIARHNDTPFTPADIEDIVFDSEYENLKKFTNENFPES